MRATGIVRRIDDLGRVVIPKEIRRTLRIRESEPLEIFTGKEGEIVLKKYSPISEMTGFAKQYMESLSQVSGRIAMVADRDQFIAVSGGMKSLLGKEISKELEHKMITDIFSGIMGIHGRKIIPKRKGTNHAKVRRKITEHGKSDREYTFLHKKSSPHQTADQISYRKQEYNLSLCKPGELMPQTPFFFPSDP